MGQKDVTDLLHQSRFRSGWTMVGIQDHELHSVWQRAGAAGPRFTRWSKKVFAGRIAEALELIEFEHDQVCKPGKVEWIERQIRRSEERRVGKEGRSRWSR